MKNFILLFGTFLMLCSGVARAEGSFSDANTLYEKGQYAQAAKAYEALINSSESTAALHYNLGNAYFRLGQKGQAMLHYEKARRLAPADKDLLWNEALLRTKLVDRLEDPAEFGFEQWVERIVLIGANGELALLLTVSLAALALIQGSAYFSGNLVTPVRWIRFFAIVTAIISASILLFQARVENTQRAVVLSSKVTARFGPSERETHAFILHEGALTRVLDETEKWVYVGLPNGQAGWIPKDTCAFV